MAQLDPDATDPGLLKKHSAFQSYTTSHCTYPSIRVFYRPHPQADKLPNKPSPLPLLVCIHGLGGSLAQFHPLLTSLVNVAPCLGIDLPGCGRSRFSPDSWDVYTTEALTSLLVVVIEQYCDVANGQGVVLIGHSMGCSLAACLSFSSSLSQATPNFSVLGLIAICPQASTPSREQIAKYRRLLCVPNSIFDLWRRWDRRGGPESASVARFVGAGADVETKKMQERFNTQSQTSVWRRMASGALPTLKHDGSLSGGLPGPQLWAGVTSPIYLIAGEADNITKPEEITVISDVLGKSRPDHQEPFKDKDALVPETMGGSANSFTGGKYEVERQAHDEIYGLNLPSTETTLLDYGAIPPDQVDDKANTMKGRRILKTSILPSPASHALLYSHSTYRTLAGLIQDFLADHIDQRLSLGWQLQHLCTEGKWEVKNFQKWQAVKPVSEPIAQTFRAMKTLREIDETHSPATFVTDWKDRIKAVIDISHESPVYDPKGLDLGGIQYHKFPTVSKIPPTTEEVKSFIELVDRLREHSPAGDDRLIGVHCHYGFNRTGFFICSYLVERKGLGVQQAINEFQMQRPPGIRHEHFIDTLFVRYCIGLKRTPTL